VIREVGVGANRVSVSANRHGTDRIIAWVRTDSTLAAGHLIVKIVPLTSTTPPAKR